ncbi:hypothetical protein [Thermomonospora cellulosilytica]|uniref:Uncharacterized protein n=1 Tax=Thermomonospora cellulosilytica TaxID=1411118 RepID=A0A7W3MUY4_9ACTN|nr:hypothetical protein [Thermomonospora cellulosilytica]MBA9002381.1 hypothetical protein [Thermomonospora cellulosilytica]
MSVIADPVYGAERFAERVRAYLRAPGFEVVVNRSHRYEEAILMPVRPGTTTPAACSPPKECTRS